jgi:hypothetical protein
MNSSHTPGNWQYRPVTQNGLNRPYEKYEIFSRTEPNYKDKWGYCVNFGSQYYDIAVVRSNHQCTEANAKLIAAAPELLQLLQQAFEELDYVTEILFDKGLQENEEYIALAALLSPIEQLIQKATN